MYTRFQCIHIELRYFNHTFILISAILLLSRSNNNRRTSGLLQQINLAICNREKHPYLKFEIATNTKTSHSISPNSKRFLLLSLLYIPSTIIIAVTIIYPVSLLIISITLGFFISAIGRRETGILHQYI